MATTDAINSMNDADRSSANRTTVSLYVDFPSKKKIPSFKQSNISSAEIYRCYAFNFLSQFSCHNDNTYDPYINKNNVIQTKTCRSSNTIVIAIIPMKIGITQLLVSVVKIIRRRIITRKIIVMIIIIEY